MGDVGDDYRALREVRKEKRASNREHSARLLREAGIPFEERNAGAHLIVAGRYDFWPGTGLWQARGDKAKQRGVRKLIERCILAGSRPGDTVLDPFMGSGTTGQVATDLGRNFIGVELNPKYVELHEMRRTTIGMPI